MATRLSLVLLIIIFASLAACKSSQLNKTPSPKAGMFKVAIHYPAGENSTFDMHYYEKKHMPMVAGLLGTTLRFYEIDKGISGRTAKDKAPFMAVGYFYVSDIAEYNKVIRGNIEAISADFKNYTNIQPVVQISEIVQVSNRPASAQK